MPVTACIKLKNGRGKTPQNYSYPQTRQFFDRTARKLKVEPPTKFEYENPDYFIQTIGAEYVKPLMVKRWKKQKEWHAASAGLKTFTALLGHFDVEGRDAVPPGVDREGFFLELKSFETILTAAARRKDSFRIEMLI